MKNSHSANSIRVFLGLSLVVTLFAVIALKGFRASAADENQARPISVWLKSQNSPLVNLLPGRDLPGVYDSKDSSSYQLQAGQNRPSALASADFDADGFPDLITGYSSPDGSGVLTVRRGNPEAFAPQNDESLALLKEGRFPDSFLENVESLGVPAAVDFLVSGDFDRDGNLDVITATRGGEKIYLFSGAGRDGGFSQVKEISLAGRVTALNAGEIDASDNRADLLVGIEDDSGASLLVFENAETGVFDSPASYRLSSAATSLELGKLDDDLFSDTAILTGDGVFILHGRDARAADKPARNIAPRLENVNLPFVPQAMAVGDFIFDRAGKTEMALLAKDGTVQIARRGELDERPFSVQEAQANRLQAFKTQTRGTFETKLKNRHIGTSEHWTIDGGNASVADTVVQRSGAAPILMKANLSGQNTDDILFLNSETREIKVLSAPSADKSDDKNSFDAKQRSVYSLEAASQPVAVLPMKLNIFARPGLVILQNERLEPSVVNATAALTLTVDRTDDTNIAAAQACTAAPGDCSLRGAISLANATAGADTIIVPAGTYTLTIPNVAPAPPKNVNNTNEDGNATGDLDINDSLTITGAGQAATIVQAGTTSANGIDKVFASNPICASVVSTSFSGLTVRYGRNTQPNGASDFSFTGGGLDWCNPGAGGTLTITNSTFDSNSATTGPGGGIDLNTASTTSGTVMMTGVTISNNKSQTPTSGGVSTPGSGGGISILGGYVYSVTVTNSTITGNTAGVLNNQATDNGGGVYFNPAIDSRTAVSVIMHGTTVSNNSAYGAGGGVYFSGSGTASFTIDQSSVVRGNTSGGTGGTNSLAQGGGLFVAPLDTGSATITKSTIINNILAASAATKRGGAGIAAGQGPVTVSYCRIVGNTGAGTLGNGLNKDTNPGATTATENWWGCSTGPSAAPCDTAVLTLGSTGSLNYTPWIVLRHTASPSTIVVGQSTTLTASFLTDSAGNALSLSNITVLLGLPITFNNPVKGTISGAQTTIQSNGTATAIFTGTSTGSGSADAIVDNDVAAAGRTNRATITINQASTTTGVTSSVNPSKVGQSVNFTATINPVSPATGTPTGTVQFVVDGSNFGSPVALSGGTATLSNVTSLSAGNHTVSANYSGDANFTSSSGSLSGGQAVIAAPSISKSFGASSILVGGSTSLSFTITNPAANTVSLTGVAFTDTLPGGLVVATPNGLTGSCGGGTITATQGSGSVSLSGATLAANASCTFSVNVTGTTAGPQNNSVTVSSTNGGTGNTATASVTVVAPPDLTITKTHTGNFSRGQTNAQYTITVTNSGGSSTSGTVTVVDNLPSGLTATAISGTGWTCTLGNLTCTRSNALAAGSSYPVITLTITVASNAASPVTNTATVSGGGETNTANDTAGDPTTVLAPTAADVEVGGQVTTLNGRGLNRAQVTITDQSGNQRTTYTNPFGYFRFENVTSGETYIISVVLKYYNFAPQVINVTDSVADLKIKAQ